MVSQLLEEGYAVHGQERLFSLRHGGLGSSV